MIENTLNLLLALPAVAMALALKPWRLLRSPPPWPALAVWAALPLLQPLSGVCILLLMLGWPLTVLALLPVGGVMWLAAGLDAGGALHRVVWLGLVPATLALALGAGVRRWLPRHLFVYIMGRGFFATALALTLSGALAAWLFGVPASLQSGDVMLARLLSAFGDAFITGMLTAIFVAFRPQWLATYADHLYLKPLL